MYAIWNDALINDKNATNIQEQVLITQTMLRINLY